MKPPIIAELRALAMRSRGIVLADVDADLLERAAHMIEAVAAAQDFDEVDYTLKEGKQ